MHCDNSSDALSISCNGQRLAPAQPPSALASSPALDARAAPSYVRTARTVMARFLVILGLILLLAGLLWPSIDRLGLGRLPGDVVFTRGGTTFYFPLMTSIIISIVLSALLWLFGR
jgi:hypothetical protein